MKKIIRLSFIILIVLIVGGCNNSSKNNNISLTKLQIIEEDVTTNEERIYKEYNIKEEDLIILHDKQFYECNRLSNDIKIVKINDDNIVISRDMLKYDSNDINKTYTEKVEESIKYNEKISTSINESNPLAGECSQAKYRYYLKFIKETNK